MFNITYEDMYQAYLSCRKRKRNKTDAKQFEKNALFNIIKLVDIINDERYRLLPSSCFIVEYPTIREVFCANFRDRIVQHFVYNELNPIIEKILINDTASCRVKKGTDYAIERAARFVRTSTNNYKAQSNYLKVDLKGFFMSINRELLLEKVLYVIDNLYNGRYKEVLRYLVRIIILTDQTVGVRYLCSKKKWDKLSKRKSLFNNSSGLPIGNITSQLFANFYLNDIDHYIKSRHKFMIRYVDDIIIVDTDKQKLQDTLCDIQQLLPKYNLTLNQNKTKIESVKYGIDFLGIKIKPYYNVLGKKRINRLYYTSSRINDLDQMIRSANSRKGMFERYHDYKVSERWYNSITKRMPNLVKIKTYKYGELTQNQMCA